MSYEPHQRTQSGKLRRAKPATIPKNNSRHTADTIQKPGIENSRELVEPDIDDEIDTYYQTPDTLCDLRKELLGRIAEGFGICKDDAIDPLWRNTWTIGTWILAGRITLSAAIMQPNITGSWVNINDMDKAHSRIVASEYTKHNLPKSVCRVIDNGSSGQIQGRWSLDLADRLIKDGTTTRSMISIANVVACQSSLFFWMILADSNVYLCRPTRDTINILFKYLPEWCMDIEEVSAGRTVSLKIKGIDNDASQLIISSTGSIRYQGKDRYLTKLPLALSTAIRDIMVSVHLQQFIDSLEYTRYGSVYELV